MGIGSRSQVRGDEMEGHPIPAWVDRWGPKVLAAGLTLQIVMMVIWVLAYSHQVDLSIYRMGAVAILHRAPMYDLGLTGRPNELLFNYPPFAAVMFIPLDLVPLTLLRLLAPIGNFLLLVFVIRRCWQSLGVPVGRGLMSLTMLGTGALLWLEPVRTTIALGQINLVLLAAVVVDLLPLSAPRRWQGVGVGIAAGIKLTPLFFIPFLLVTRRLRAAAVATAAFVGTLVAGSVIAPSQASEYWFHGVFDDLNRVAPVASTGNESLRGAIARLALPTGAAASAWIIGALLVAVCCLAVAGRVHEDGDEVLAVALCGLGSAAISPFSWGYHWVWFVPLAVHLGDRAIMRGSRGAAVLLATMWVATAAWITGWRDPLSGMTPPSGVISLNPGGALLVVTRNVYLLVFMAALLIATVRRRTHEASGLSPIA
jgi:alpha-1,2-mannosyltransferase